MITAQVNGDLLQVTLDADLTIYLAAELHAELVPWLETPCNWTLDLAAVSECDGAGLQLLLMLRQHLAGAGRVLTLVGRSPGVNEALSLSGLAASFDDQAVA